MYKRLQVCCVILLLCVPGLAGCSGEELLMQVPETIQISAEKSEASSAQSSEAVPSVTEAVQKEFFLEEGTKYAYNTLSAPEQVWYQDMVQAMGTMTEEYRLNDDCLKQGLTEEHIDKIFQCVLTDYPDLFYVDGYSYTQYQRGTETVGIVFKGRYLHSREEVSRRYQEIQQAAEAILSGVSPDAGEYERVEYVYETVIRNTDYDLNAPDNQNIYSVFVGGASVCQGYAKAAQYLLNRLGVECVLVQGEVYNGEGHAWNLVNVDGSYYYVDATWGDVSYLLVEGVDMTNKPEINYDYLCVTTRQLYKTHIPGDLLPLPECVDTAANYYVRRDAVFTAYDTERLHRLFAQGITDGAGYVTVKCESEECYQEMMQLLLVDQEIFDYLPEGENKVSYSQDDKQLSLTFWVTNE